MSTRKLVTTGLMLAIALVFQIGFAQFAQPLVGPLVNMTLLITVVVAGIPSGIMVGVFTPLIAFALGIMAFLPAVPFIIVANFLYVLLFGLIRDKMKPELWAGPTAVAVAALVKFAFLAATIRWVVPLFVAKVPPALVTAFSIPQLITAIIGGAVALLLTRLMRLKRII